MRILGLFPLTGNGGIASWTKKYLATFPDKEYAIYPVNVSPEDRTGSESKIYRIFSGLNALRRILKEVKQTIVQEKIEILHTTTSGNLGSYRDMKVARICKKYGVRSVMHCRYGCITEDINSKNLVGYLLRKTMPMYDQIWVLDTRSYNTLRSIPYLADKVFLTPNSIEVNEEIDLTPKKYQSVVFVGNLIPSKGLYELVTACVTTNVRLDIIGPGSPEVIERIKTIANDKLNVNIFIHGRMANHDAVEVMKQADIVALPTYYPSEAFPISIIEAMSLSKLVISCPRAAIRDMLMGLDGKPCGILVPPRSSADIVEAIHWCQSNPLDADAMCRSAYQKVYTAYRKEVVYDLYRENYKKLISNDIN